MFVTLIKSPASLHSIDLAGNIYNLSKLTEEQFLFRKEKYVVIRVLLVLRNDVLVIDSDKKITRLSFLEGLGKFDPEYIYDKVNESDLYSGFTNIELIDYERVEYVIISKRAIAHSTISPIDLNDFFDAKLIKKENITNRLSLGGLNPFII